MLFIPLFFLVLIIVVPNVPTIQSNTATTAPAVELWRGIYHGVDKMGRSKQVIVTNARSTVITEEVELRVTTNGVRRRLRLRSKFMIEGYELRSFEFDMDTDSSQIKAWGKRNGETLNIEISHPSGKRELSIPFDDNTLVFPVLYRWLIDRSPEPGDNYKVKVFEPSLTLTGRDLNALAAEIAVSGRETLSTSLGERRTLRLNVSYDGKDSTVWIDDNGVVVKQISDPGMTTVVESREKAMGDEIEYVDLVAKTAVASNVKLKRPRSLKRLKLRLSGIDPADGFTLNDGYRQTYEQGLLEVRARDLAGIEGYEPPYLPDDKTEFTQPESLIQSDHPRIVSLARKITGGNGDALSTVKKLTSWVYRNIEKEPTISVPDALETLETMKGDCNEHTAVFTALARAAGIPTKIALGLVYTKGAFYYHAWNEVYVGEWIAVDSTFGQVPADASHIKLLEGSMSKSSEIVKIVGKIKLEIKETGQL